MRHRLFTHHFTAWLASWAILLGAFAPVVTQWLNASPADGLSWVEVCSASGSKWMAIGPAAFQIKSKQTAPQDQPARDHAQGHCAFCLLHTDTVGLPPQPVQLFIPVTGSDALPSLFLHAPRPLFAWSASQARAPPSLS